MGRRIVNILVTIILAVAICAAAVLLFARISGGGAYAVLSGSMEPDYPVGSLIVVKRTDPSTLKEGDVITYALSKDMTATHRIVSINQSDSGDLSFITKGDANKDADAAPVISQNVIGKPFLTIPYLGYAINFMATSPGRYITIGAAILLILLSLITGKKKERAVTD